jgi:hypothetical protein
VKAQAVSSAPEGVCGKHEFIERTLVTLSGQVEEGFREVNKVLTDIRIDLARREESEKGQWHEIRALRGKVEELPAFVVESLADHVRECPLQDITEVGIKQPPRERRNGTHETPVRGTVRTSAAPRRDSVIRMSKTAVGIGVGIAAVILGVGIWVGVMLATGSPDQATGAVRDLAGQAAAAAQK